MKVILLVTMFLALTMASYEVYQDLEGSKYVLIPLESEDPVLLQRQRRQTRGQIEVGGSHTKGQGSDIFARGTYNVWRRGPSSLDAVGQYSRHFQGPSGTGRPNYYGGLQFNHRF